MLGFYGNSSVRRTTADPVNLSLLNKCNALCLSANRA